MLEARNNELEDENLILSEEHKITMSINKEFYLFLSKSHSKIREMNSIIYEGCKNQPDEQFEYEDLAQNLSKVKEFKTSIENDLNKISRAVEKFRFRKSKPEKLDHPNSPASFDFEGDDNEIFGESFVIDSNNKELEEKLDKVEKELKLALEQIDDRDKTIEDLKTQIEELEKGGRSSALDMKKSESFEMMNSESISHIKNVLIQFL
jgi:chaperonin cofactor prefoldin